ncbi:MAG: nickel pincer cofactor biosynthesis protein LarC [Eubacterium sp.]|nr:nickel pincer cofactor biosynthesis protein LarC [Eubacterium sp.]
MKTLYLDCSMGAAGDMLTAALLELISEQDQFIEEMNALGIPGVHVTKETSVKCGITGTHVCVTVNGVEEESCDVHPHGNLHEEGCGHEYSHTHQHEEDYGQEHSHTHQHGEDYGHDHNHPHHHSGLHDIEHIVRDHLNLPSKVQEDVMSVYALIAEAESKAHGRPVTEIHFHEVGTMDAIADIAAVCLLMDRISPDEVVVSPVHVGSGQIRCAHGILPVPAPATAYILRDVPIYGGAIRGELCTPTGAALLKYYADRFGQMPIMRTTAIGYGMGKKDFEAANCVRAMLGETYTEQDKAGSTENEMHVGQSEAAIAENEPCAGQNKADSTQNEICELSCNVDDMTAEAVGFAMERLFADGALDVYTVPIGMKKSRPGILIHVMCRRSDKENMIRSIFKHTTTIGIRASRLDRYVLDRRMETLDTPYGKVRCKVSSGYGVERRKYEYEDLSRIARERKISICEAENLIKSCDETRIDETKNQM